MSKNKTKKQGQSLIEFLLVALLVGIVSFWAFLKLNPQFFRSMVKGSIAGSNVNNSGQMTMPAMGD